MLEELRLLPPRGGAEIAITEEKLPAKEELWVLLARGGAMSSSINLAKYTTPAIDEYDCHKM